AVLPGGFGPPADDVFADAVEGGVAVQEIQDPVREEVDVGVAGCGKHAYPAVFAEKAMADGEAVFAVGDVVEGVCGRGVDHLGDVRAE
ncbi:MAG: hypothetical protein LQ348_007166, partial [Seirophora lacunosa]